MGRCPFTLCLKRLREYNPPFHLWNLPTDATASNDNSAGHANKWKAKHETGNANSEIVVSVHETMKSNHEMSAEGMGRTFCSTPKMATAVADDPGMVNMGAEAAVRVI